ncbi:hypothetical protein KR018_011878 [Drosophila ironensis]|nr:hypothetical protein KR018_011878 [Drosophila ironensis]
MGHRNICCDGCQRQDFRGRRFRCMRCVNFDLCGDCYDRRVETHEHRVEHPMQLILEPGQMYSHSNPHSHPHPEGEVYGPQLQLLGGGEVLDLMHLSNCYTCPYCGLFGHTAKRLIQHVCTQHRQADGYVVCPMCAGLPTIELVAIRNLSRHLLLDHIEHANMLEPETPPLRRFLARSSQRSRRRRQLLLQQQQDQFPLQPEQEQPERSPQQQQPLPTGRRQPAIGYDAMMQLAEVPGDSWTTEPLLPSSIEISEDEPRTRSSGIFRSGGESQALPLEDSTTGTTTTSQTTLEATSAGVNGSTDQFHLIQWIAQQEQLCQETEVAKNRKLRHALFTEHLLLSLLSTGELMAPRRELGGSSGRPKEQVGSHLSRAMSLMSLPWTRAWRAAQLVGNSVVEGPDLEKRDESGSEVGGSARNWEFQYQENQQLQEQKTDRAEEEAID